MKDNNSGYSKESERKDGQRQSSFGLIQLFVMRTCAFYFKEPSTGLEQFMYAATNAARLKNSRLRFHSLNSYETHTYRHN